MSVTQRTVFVEKEQGIAPNGLSLLKNSLLSLSIHGFALRKNEEKEKYTTKKEKSKMGIDKREENAV